MTDVSKAEAELVVAKAECFKTCGQLDPDVADDRAMAEKVHEEHREELEAAYAAFQRESGLASVSNPAVEGTNLVEANMVVDTGLN